MPITAEVLLEHGLEVKDASCVLLCEWLKEQELDCLSDLRMCGPLADLPGHIDLHPVIAHPRIRSALLQVHRTYL